MQRNTNVRNMLKRLDKINSHPTISDKLASAVGFQTFAKHGREFCI